MNSYTEGELALGDDVEADIGGHGHGGVVLGRPLDARAHLTPVLVRVRSAGLETELARV